MSKFTNPMLQKLSKITERDDLHFASYKGIGLKTFYFLLMTGVGALIYFLVHSMVGGTGTYTVSEITVYSTEAIIFVMALIFAVISPLLVWLIKPLACVLGTMYSLSQGFLIAMSATFVPEYQHLIYIAFGITVLIVLVMLFLYTKRIVKVGHRFKAIISTLFFTSILGSLAYAILFVVAPTNPIILFVQSSDGMVGIIASLIGIVIASLFLLSDFDRIERTVEDQLPKKYEWIASFGLVFTIIWLYLKVLNLLARVESSQKK